MLIVCVHAACRAACCMCESVPVHVHICVLPKQKVVALQPALAKSVSNAMYVETEILKQRRKVREKEVAAKEQRQKKK